MLDIEDLYHIPNGFHANMQIHTMSLIYPYSLWTAPYEQCLMNSALWSASYEQRLMISVLWTAACEQRLMNSALWTAPDEQHLMNSALWTVIFINWRLKEIKIMFF